MPRAARRESSTNIYHVIVRGVNRRVTFEDDRDRERFLELLSYALQQTGGDLYAWCLMTNHVHLLLCMSLDRLSACMKTLNQSYAEYFNWRHGRTGHLYEQRYRSEAVETEAYLLTVTRYIHQNPVKAFMVPDCQYEWSSYGQYLGKDGARDLCDTDVVLGAFGGLAEFLQFHATVAFDDRCLEILQKMPDKDARIYAERIIGADRFQNLGNLGVEERDGLLRTLKRCMIPSVQIARITGFSPSTVSRAG